MGTIIRGTQGQNDFETVILAVTTPHTPSLPPSLEQASQGADPEGVKWGG